MKAEISLNQDLERPSLDEYFLQIASVVSSRSTCVRRQCGAVIVKDGQIISTGYNGAPSGCPHCTKETCIRLIQNIPSGTRHEICRGAHAEQNAIAQAARHGIAVDESTIYITGEPCSMCAKNIINAGITTIIIGDCSPYNDELALKLLKESGIKVYSISFLEGRATRVPRLSSASPPLVVETGSFLQGYTAVKHTSPPT